MHLALIALSLALAAPRSAAPRSFESSFESIADFNGHYIVPPGDYASTHEIATDKYHLGAHAHKAWILSARAADNDGPYLPHRAYPTLQMAKLPGGLFKTPCLVSLWVWLDITLQLRPGGTNDWFSFLTLTPDTSNQWVRTVVADLTADNAYVHLVHVPLQGQQDRLFQASAANDPQGALRFPQRQWVRLDAYIDFDSAAGYAKVWQNGQLVSHAKVEGGAGYLAQAHFGLYASAAISAGTIYNDDLRIQEVADEAAALALIQASTSVAVPGPAVKPDAGPKSSCDALGRKFKAEDERLGSPQGPPSRFTDRTKSKTTIVTSMDVRN